MLTETSVTSAYHILSSLTYYIEVIFKSILLLMS